MGKIDQKLPFKKRYLEFVIRFGTEKKCRDYLFQWRWPNEFKCPSCGHNEYSRHTTRLLYECKKCRKQTSITAGTFFDKTRAPLMTWFRMIFLVTNKKISTRELQKKLKMKSYETALRNRKKIEGVLNPFPRMGENKEKDYNILAGIVDIKDIAKWKSRRYKADEKEKGRVGRRNLLGKFDTASES